MSGLHAVEAGHERLAELVRGVGRHDRKEDVQQLLIGHALHQQHHAVHVRELLADVAGQGLLAGQALCGQGVGSLHAQAHGRALPVAQEVVQRLDGADVVDLGEEFEDLAAEALLPEAGLCARGLAGGELLEQVLQGGDHLGAVAAAQRGEHVRRELWVLQRLEQAV